MGASSVYLWALPSGIQLFEVLCSDSLSSWPGALPLRHLISRRKEAPGGHAPHSAFLMPLELGLTIPY